MKDVFTNIDGIMYTHNLDTDRYSKKVFGKTSRIGKAEFEAASAAHDAEVAAKMHENLEKLNREQNEKNEFFEITEEDIERDARELERYLQETEESNTDEEIAAIIENMDDDAEDDSISAEEFIEKVQKVEKEKKVRKAKKAKAAKKNAAYVFSNGGVEFTLTAKQVDFIRHLPDTCFWQDGLDSAIWIDCLCDEIKGQFSGKPMTVGAMISTLCEKGLGTRGKNRVNGRKCTSFALTDWGKAIAKDLGLH